MSILTAGGAWLPTAAGSAWSVERGRGGGKAQDRGEREEVGVHGEDNTVARQILSQGAVPAHWIQKVERVGPARRAVAAARTPA
ncbi:MAG: hypothetical protein IPL39_00060 [Opitutaceae bacterium]|nr:hypothetical protein [Opitutaceae bacterium]